MSFAIRRSLPLPVASLGMAALLYNRTTRTANSDALLPNYNQHRPPPAAPAEIPRRFVDGCGKDALRRWEATKAWRTAERIDQILSEPQPHFHAIKELSCHYNAGYGRNGNVVFWERPAAARFEEMAARGITTEHLVRHWLFVTEYQWAIVCKGDETAKSIAVYDLKGVGMWDLTGRIWDYTQKTITIANMHYPERSYAVIVINAPYFTSYFWKMIKPYVHANTQDKVQILSEEETLEGLQKHIDISQIPVYYGGNLDFGGKDSCRTNSPEQRAMNAYVDKLNTGTGSNHNSSICATSGVEQNRKPWKQRPPLKKRVVDVSSTSH